MNDAQVYCLSAVNSINNLRATNPEFQSVLNQQISQTKNNLYFQKITFAELVEQTVKFTRENVINAGEKLDDVNTVAFQLGILCYIFRNSCPATNNEFDKLFIDTWNQYFESHLI